MVVVIAKISFSGSLHFISICSSFTVSDLIIILLKRLHSFVCIHFHYD